MLALQECVGVYITVQQKYGNHLSSLGRQDLVTKFLVKMTFLYKLVAKKLDFVMPKLQISF